MCYEQASQRDSGYANKLPWGAGLAILQTV